MKTKYLLLFVLLIASISHAQMRLPDGNITLGLPSQGQSNTSARNVSVDLYTGQLNVGVSIYHYSNPTTKLDHEVSLNFNGGGIKINDVPSDVGANWSLEVGGNINREIRGLPDDAPNGWLTYQGAEPSFSQPNPTDSVELEKYISSTHDGDFDLYHFNIGNTGGNFICGRDGAGILQMPISNIIITAINNPNNFSGAPVDSCNSRFFEIKNEKGVRYLFSNLNCLRINLFNEQVTYGTTKWYLTKIIAPNNDDSIVFNYAVNIQDYFSNNELAYTALPPLPAGATSDYCTGNYPSESEQKSRELILTSINYTNGTTVAFNQGFNRTDLRSNKVVDNIKITNGNSETGYKLNYIYTSINPNIPNLAYQDFHGAFTWSESQHRLTLVNVKRFSGYDTLPYYRFIYNPTKSDNWFNGLADIYGFARTTTPYNDRIQQYNFQGTSVAGGLALPDRGDNSPMSLDTIIIPSGGKIAISYEANTTRSDISGNDMGLQSIDKVGGLRVTQLSQIDGTQQSNNTIKTYSYVEDDGRTSSGIIANFPMFGYKYTETYEPGRFYQTRTFHKIVDCGNWPVLTNNVSTYDFLIRSKNPLNRLLLTHGSNVGYGRVEEYIGTPTNFRQKNVYRFSTSETNPVPSGLMQNNFPFPYIPDLDFAWGLDLGKEEYSQSGILLHKTVNSYDVFVDKVGDSAFIGLKVGLNKFPNRDLSCYSIKHYFPMTGKAFLKSTSDTTYFSGNIYSSNNTSFDYDESKNVVKHIYFKNAKDQEMRSDYYYPFEFASTGPIGLLNSSGRIYDAIRIETWKVATNELMDVKLSDYGLFNGVPRIANSYAFTPDQPITASAWGTFNPNQILQVPQLFTLLNTADVYDGKGNTLQQTVKGIKQSTIWSESGKYPVALITNAELGDVAYANFESEMYGWQPVGNYQYGYNHNTYAYNGEYNGFAGGGFKLQKNSLNQSKTYQINCWAQSVPVIKATVNGMQTQVQLATGTTHKGWTFYSGKFNNATSVSIGDSPSQVYIDELRLFPDGASMTTYTYNSLWGITSECDATAKTIYYEYDGFGRIKYKRDLDGNIIQASDYKNQEPQY